MSLSLMRCCSLLLVCTFTSSAVASHLAGSSTPGTEQTEAPKPQRAREQTKKKKKRAPKDFMHQNLRRVGPSRYSISKIAQSYYLSDPTFLKLKVLTKLKYEKGVSIGYSLIYVSTRSPLRLLGFKEEDIITSINGLKVTSMLRAMSAYYAYKDDTHYKIKLLRKGKRRLIQIKVR